MSRRWEDVLAILKGEKSPPLSQFIGFSGALSAEQQGELFSVLEKSEFRRAIRFKGAFSSSSTAVSCLAAFCFMYNG